MSTGSTDPNTILEIAKVVASLGLSASVIVLSILAWRSPLLAHEFFAFVRGLIGDFRSRPKSAPRAKTKQTSIDSAE
jgi:hypothetical protein